MNVIVKTLCVLAFVLALPALGATQVDINSADAVTLAKTLNGVGLVKAEAIVAYRNTHGPFEDMDDLSKVEGIGPRILEENREAIVFGSSRPHPPRNSGDGPPRTVSTR